MTHLGDRLTAFVDGELPHDARERVLAHLAGCAQCRAAAEAERVVKALVAAAEGPPPSDELIRQLLMLAEPGEPLPPRRQRLTSIDASPRPPAVPVGGWTLSAPPDPGRSPGRRPGATGRPTNGRPSGTPARPPARRPGRLLRQRHHTLPILAGVSLVAVALGAAVALGGQEQPGPAVGPGDDSFAVEHAATTGGLPLVDPAMSLTVGFGPGTGGGASYGPTSLGATYGPAYLDGGYVGGVPPR